jgi:hypothetical protein
MVSFIWLSDKKTIFFYYYKNININFYIFPNQEVLSTGVCCGFPGSAIDRFIMVMSLFG